MSLAVMDMMVMDVVVLPCSPPSSHCCCSVFSPWYNKACQTIRLPANCFEVHPWCGLCHCRCCCCCSDWHIMFLPIDSWFERRNVVLGNIGCRWQLQFIVVDGNSLLLIPCRRLSQVCRSYTFNNKQQDGRYHSGTNTWMPFKLLTDISPHHLHWHFLRCTQLRAMFLINTGCAWNSCKYWSYTWQYN